MNITRNNYEEFFILYLDNELNREERSRVEFFLQQHPDLQEELSMLQQTRLVPDTQVIFKGKQSLWKSSTQCDISLANYEEWLLLYIDDELTIEQEVTVENFAIANPAVKAELDILQKTKLQPEESIIYFNKESLYRKEEKERPVAVIRWWRITAAAALLFAVSITGFLIYNNNKKGVDQPLAGNNGIKNNTIKKEVPVQPIVKQKGQESINQTLPEKKDMQQPLQVQAKKNTIPVQQPVREIPVRLNPEENQIAFVSPNETNTNNLPDPVNNPNIKGSIGITSATLTKLKDIDPNSLVTNSNPPSFKFTGNNLQPDETDESEMTSVKKTKFRGLLRKITRTFEKTTNIKATDDDDRLLVGGLAIRL
jgi:hypothetical protein